MVVGTTTWRTARPRLLRASWLLRKQGDAERAEKLLTEPQVAPAVSTRVLAADGKHRPVKLKKRA